MRMNGTVNAQHRICPLFSELPTLSLWFLRSVVTRLRDVCGHDLGQDFYHLSAVLWSLERSGWCDGICIRVGSGCSPNRGLCDSFCSPHCPAFTNFNFPSCKRGAEVFRCGVNLRVGVTAVYKEGSQDVNVTVCDEKLDLVMRPGRGRMALTKQSSGRT